LHLKWHGLSFGRRLRNYATQTAAVVPGQLGLVPSLVQLNTREATEPRGWGTDSESSKAGIYNSARTVNEGQDLVENSRSQWKDYAERGQDAINEQVDKL
jgi:hypothetical protein